MIMAAEGGAERGLLLKAEFNDGDTVNAMFERLNVCYENTMYEKMKRQAEDDPSPTLRVRGDKPPKINLLIFNRSLQSIISKDCVISMNRLPGVA